MEDPNAQFDQHENETVEVEQQNGSNIAMPTNDNHIATQNSEFKTTAPRSLSKELEEIDKQSQFESYPREDEDAEEKMGSPPRFLPSLLNTLNGLISGLVNEETRQMQRKAREAKMREEKLAKLTRLWLQEILPGWESKKDTGKVRQLCWQGIPPGVRGVVWPRIIGNTMQITPELYNIFAGHARSSRIRVEKFSECMLDGTGSLEDEEALDRELFLGKEASLKLITADLPRTFPALKFFHGDGPCSTPLREILEAYIFFRPDIGYVQGMSYIAAMFLLFMDGYTAFQCFANLLNSRIHMDFFRLNTDQIACHLSIYDSIFQENLPRLHSHFSDEGVAHSMYLMDWLMTIFTKALSLDIASHIWDIYLLEGEMFFFRAALGILKMFSSYLESADLGEILNFLKKLPQDLDDSVLFDSIKSINVSQRKIDELQSLIWNNVRQLPYSKSI